MKQIPNVNWSRVAARAFELELGQIASHQASTDMAAVIQRLRASRVHCESEVARKGYDAGRMWAMRTADARQLQRLAEIRMATGRNWWSFFQSCREANPGENFLAQIAPTQRLNHKMVGDFWDEALGVGNLSTVSCVFVQGFAEGALALWDEVADKVDHFELPENV